MGQLALADCRGSMPAEIIEQADIAAESRQIHLALFLRSVRVMDGRNSGRSLPFSLCLERRAYPFQTQRPAIGR